MENKTKLIRIRDVLTETQRCNINSLFKRYGLKFTKKISITERCDMRKITKRRCRYNVGAKLQYPIYMNLLKKF